VAKLAERDDDTRVSRTSIEPVAGASDDATPSLEVKPEADDDDQGGGDGEA
jgi:hypothetical protein